MSDLRRQAALRAAINETRWMTVFLSEILWRAPVPLDVYRAARRLAVNYMRKTSSGKRKAILPLYAGEIQRKRALRRFVRSMRIQHMRRLADALDGLADEMELHRPSCSVRCHWCEDRVVASTHWRAARGARRHGWKCIGPDDDEYASMLCRRCSAVCDEKLRLTTIWAAAYGVKFGVMPLVHHENFGEATHVVYARGFSRANLVPDAATLAAARAFADMTTIKPERAVIARNGARWVIREAQ